MPTVTSGNITLIDLTDTKKVDVYISANKPTVQIYDGKTYTPNWSEVGKSLVLTATVYADATPVTNMSTYRWVQMIGDGTEEYDLEEDTNQLTISSNIPSEVSMIRYKCYATYNKVPYSNEITFTRINDGISAPMVQAQYSVDGTNGSWENILDSTIHKYIHFSYDGGINWTAAIKIAGEKGEDGQDISLKGTAYTTDDLVVGSAVELYSDQTTQNKIKGDEPGDSYLVDGYLCVYNGSQFICTGQLQGPKGEDGATYYLYIRYADNTSGSGFSTSPGNKKYIGFYRTTSETLPTNVDKTSATWNWAKFVGDNAKTITLIGNAQAFKVDKNNAVLPTTITVTAQAENTSVTSWTYRVDNETIFTSNIPIGVSINGNDVTITGSEMTANSIAIKASDGTHSDVFTVYKVSDGSDGKQGDKGDPAPTVFLTNENISFAANSNGQVEGTTVYCDVVAYKGTTKVTPTVGTILSSELPTGMSLGERTTISNQVRIPIIIANNATLGSEQNENGVITIPVTSPVSTNLQLTWSKINSGVKGDTGVGINSVTVYYGVSDSASTKPADDKWQLTIPSVAEGQYLWTRTVTDYTDSSIEDTVVYTYAKQGVKGDTGSSGSSVTVNKIEYQAGTSATTAPTGTWSNNVVSVSDGNYLWTKTTFSDNKVAYGVAKQGVKGDKGDKGDAGRGISKITEYYLATTESSSVTTDASGWTTTIQTINATKRYLWNYELITYTDGTTNKTTPVIIGVFGNTGNTGKGIKSVTEYYLATALSSGVTIDTTGWTTTMQTLTTTNKYLWNYELITYTDNSTTTIEPVIVGVYGDKGLTGDRGSDAIVFQVYSENGYILSKDVPSITLQTFAYNGDVPIEAEATYQWYKYADGNWTIITDATNSSLKVSHSDISFSSSYMCKMLFNEIEYVGVATIDDKSDVNEVFTSKPSNYSKGDVWIVGADYIPNGFTTGTVLRSQYPNSTYDDKDWIAATKYDAILNDVTKYIDSYKQYFDFDSDDGLKITATNKDGVKSKFSTTLTNEHLAFNYNDESIAYINGTSMHIKEAEIESPLTITGKYSGSTMKQAPTLNIGNFSIVVESNGSLSIISNT